MDDRRRRDDAFFERADAHILLANDQITPNTGRGRVSASLLYAAARFNAFVSASGVDNADAMAAARDRALEDFCSQYRQMLEEHLTDYIAHFDDYMKPEGHS